MYPWFDLRVGEGDKVAAGQGEGLGEDKEGGRLRRPLGHRAVKAKAVRDGLGPLGPAELRASGRGGCRCPGSSARGAGGSSGAANAIGRGQFSETGGLKESLGPTCFCPCLGSGTRLGRLPVTQRPRYQAEAAQLEGLGVPRPPPVRDLPPPPQGRHRAQLSRRGPQSGIPGLRVGWGVGKGVDRHTNTHTDYTRSTAHTGTQTQL